MTNEIQGKSQYTDPGRGKKKGGGADWLKIKAELTLHIMNFDLDPINLTQWPACPKGSMRKGERVLFLNCLTACK